MQLEIFQYETFRRHARNYLEPAIIHKWKTDQLKIFQQLHHQGGKVTVAGDMRADSPGKQKQTRQSSARVTGVYYNSSKLSIDILLKSFETSFIILSSGHSAKFGSYTLMHLGSNTIVDFQLVQV